MHDALLDKLAKRLGRRSRHEVLEHLLRAHLRARGALLRGSRTRDRRAHVQLHERRDIAAGCRRCPDRELAYRIDRHASLIAGWAIPEQLDCPWQFLEIITTRNRSGSRATPGADSSDPRGFAIDVVDALTEEAEDGSSLLARVLDEASRKAIEDGSEHFVDIAEEAREAEEP